MTSREIVINQIRHIPTEHIPYTVSFESDFVEKYEKKLQDYFSCKDIVNDLNPYMTQWFELIDMLCFEDPTLDLPTTDAVDAWGTEQVASAGYYYSPLDEADLSQYKFPDSSIFINRIEEKRDYYMKRCEDNKDVFKVAKFYWGTLFERSCMINGMENLLVNTIAEPEFVHEMMDNIMNIYIDVIYSLKDIPFDAICLGDDWGDQRGLILGKKSWEEFIKPREIKLAKAIHDTGKLYIHHTCGSVPEIIDDMHEIGIDCIESVQPESAGMELIQLKAKSKGKVALMGGLGSQTIIPNGTPEEIKAHIKHIAEQFKKEGGYIFAPSKPLQGDTPFENAVAIIEGMREYL